MKTVSFGNVIGVIGSVLIAVGIAWLVAQNWHQLPAAGKILILALAVAASYVSSTFAKERGYVGTASSLLVLGALLYSWSVFLIAQIFHTSTSMQGVAWLWLLCWIGVIAAAYIFESAASLLIGLTEFLVWLSVQFIAFMEVRQTYPGVFALWLLALAVLFYGLRLWHAKENLPFSRLYTWWTAFYVLAFAYLLSFQTILPQLWRPDSLTSTPTLAVLGVLAVLGLGSVATAWKQADREELSWFAAIIAVLGFLVALAYTVRGEDVGVFYGGSLSAWFWAFWLLVNVVFIGIIIAVLGYGTKHSSPAIINLGIVVFALDIVTRYIGFIIDFGGYTGLAFIFITGGIILLAGGYGLEKWRKKLLESAKG